MDKCCRTCHWFRNGQCHNDDMMIKREYLEEVIDDIFLNIKVDAKESHLRDVVAVFGEIVFSRVEDVNFVPPDDREFYCKYYE